MGMFSDQHGSAMPGHVLMDIQLLLRRSLPEAPSTCDGRKMNVDVPSRGKGISIDRVAFQTEVEGESALLNVDMREIRLRKHSRNRSPIQQGEENP